MNLELCKLSSFRIWLSKNFSFLHSLSIFAKLLLPGSGLPAGRHPNVDVRRHHEPETLPHGGEVEVVHVVDILEGVGLVGADICLVRLLGRDVQVVVLGDELLQLGLDVGDLGPGELKLVQGHVGLFQVSEEAELLGPEDHEGVSLAALAPGGPAHPMDVILAVGRDVKVNNNVHMRDIKSSACHVCCQQNRSRFGFELVETRQPLVLIHLTIEGDRSEAEAPQHQRQPQRGRARAAEDHKRVPSHLVQNVDQI